MLVAIVAIALSGAPPAQSPPPAQRAAISVRVDVTASADAIAKTGADELQTAIVARKDEFRLVKAGATPDLVVSVDRVMLSDDGRSGMVGSLAKGKTVRPFSLVYRGDLKALSAALARKLRDFADQIKPSPEPAK